MPTIPFQIQTTGATDLRALSAKLRATGNGDLRRRLTTAIRQAGAPAVDAARDGIMSQSFEAEGVTVKTPGTKFRKAARSSHGGGYKQRTRVLVDRATTEVARKRALKRDTGLRATIARNVKLSTITSGGVTTTGVRIVVPKNIVPKWVNPARDTESGDGWRHPVFGNQNVWVAEKAGPWFSVNIQKQAPAVRQAILQAMDDTLQELGG